MVASLPGYEVMVASLPGYKVMVASLPGYEVISIRFEVVKIAASSNFITS